jgi:hypothetical protein
MKAIFLAVLFSGVQSAFSGVLQDIGLRVSIAPGVYHVKAGDSIEIPVAISVAHPEVENTVELTFWGFNLPVDGAKPFYLNFPLIENGKILQLPTKLVFPTTTAMMGDYSIKAHSDDLGEWAEVISFDDNVVIHVDNSPATTDVDGPVTGTVSMKPKFKRGEPIQLEVSVTDASALCLDANSSAYCQVDPVIAFVCREQNGICPDDGQAFIGAMSALGGGRYSVTLKERIKPGAYELELLNFIDVWGNQLTGTSQPVVFEVEP